MNVCMITTFTKSNTEANKASNIQSVFIYINKYNLFIILELFLFSAFLLMLYVSCLNYFFKI